MDVGEPLLAPVTAYYSFVNPLSWATPLQASLLASREPGLPNHR